MLLSLNGRRVYFDLAGPANAPVVCFTHSLNSDGGMWVEQMVPLLGAGYRVLRLDMRGHGGSAAVEGDYSMDALAADVKEALDVLGITKVHFIGLSIGGMIGQGFALAHPGYLASLTLCVRCSSSHTVYRTSSSSAIPSGRRPSAIAAMTDGLRPPC